MWIQDSELKQAGEWILQNKKFDFNVEKTLIRVRPFVEQCGISPYKPEFDSVLAAIGNAARVGAAGKPDQGMVEFWRTATAFVEWLRNEKAKDQARVAAEMAKDNWW